MASLSDTVLHRMAGYPLTTVSPLDNIVPDTDDHDFRQHACWNWALSGGLDQFPPFSTPDVIYNAIFEFGPEMTYPIAVKDPVVGIYNCDEQLAVIREKFDDAFTDKQDAERIMVALIQIAAKMNNLQLSDDPNPPYWLYMNTQNGRSEKPVFWGWTHWAIAVRLGEKLSFVQTVPGYALYQAGETMWDYPNPQARAGLAGLCALQVEVLNAIRPSGE